MGAAMVRSLSLFREIFQCGGGKCPQSCRCGMKRVAPTLGYLASYARFAIHLGRFSPELEQIVRCTRNKIAQDGAAALRLLPVFPRQLASPGIWTACRRALTKSTSKF